MEFLDPGWLYSLSVLLLVFIATLKSGFKLGSSGIKWQSKFARKFSLITVLKISLFVSLVALILAMARPQITVYHKEKTLVTKDVIVAADVSGSMSQPMKLIDVPAQYSTKIGIGAYIVTRLTQNLHHTHIGLLACDTNGLYNLWPVSSNYAVVAHRANWLMQYTLKMGAGDNMAGPNQYGMPIGCLAGSADMFKAMHDGVKSREVIIITDGEPPMSLNRTKQLIDQYAKMHIKVVMLLVNPSLPNDNIASMTRFVKMAHGEIVNVRNLDNINTALSFVHNLTLSRVHHVVKQSGHLDVYPEFAVLGLSLLIVSFFLLVFIT